MRLINWLIDRIAIGGLVIASGLLWLTVLILSLSLIFNFPPYITYNNGRSTIGVADYRKGIPVSVELSSSIPDSSILVERKDGSSESWNIWKEFSRPDYYVKDSTVLHADTVITNYELPGIENRWHDLQVTHLSFSSGKAYLQTSSWLQKLVLNLPLLLKWAVLAYCAWQLAMLLSFIQSGEAFVSRNNRRLSKIGWAIVGLYVFMCFYEVLLKQFNSLSVSFSSTGRNYYAPFQVNASFENSIGITWLIAGCIILILARAFRKGARLQQEQDLTV